MSLGMQSKDPALTQKLMGLVQDGLNPEQIVKCLQAEATQKALEEVEGPADDEVFANEIVIIAQALAYREATIDDAPIIVRLLNAAYSAESTGDEAFRQGPAVSIEMIVNLFADSSYKWQVVEAPNGRGVEVDGVMLGVSCFSTDGVSRKNGEVEGTLGSIRLFGVLPRFHGVCIGRRLLHRVEQQVANAGCCRIMACVPSPRISMATWLERRGYRQASTSPYPTKYMGHEILSKYDPSLPVGGEANVGYAAGLKLELLMFVKALTNGSTSADSKSSIPTVLAPAATSTTTIVTSDTSTPVHVPPIVPGRMHLPPHWRGATSSSSAGHRDTSPTRKVAKQKVLVASALYESLGGNGSEEDSRICDSKGQAPVKQPQHEVDELGVD